MRPNVIVLVLDTARADALEPYAAPAGSSPVIADLARRGTAFESAYATACWTLPSHASMFTGMLPRAAGVFDLPEGNPLGAGQVMARHADRMLPEILRRAGYSTAAVSTNLWVTELSGFGAGFDSFEFVDTGRQARMHREDVRSRLRWDAETARARVDDGAERALEALVRLADGPPSQPFFWFVNLVECHSPYLPPKPYNDLGPIDRLRAAEEARHYLTLGAIWKACVGAIHVPDDALERMRHLYARSVLMLDAWLGRLLEALDGRGLLDDTLILATSDHGENFGENGYMAHAFSLDDRLLHVPLIAAGPGAAADGGVVSLADLPRLISGAAGIESHPWGDARSDGFAAAQFEPPAREEHPKWRPAFAEWGVDYDFAINRLARELTCVTDGRLKLQRRGTEEELYDLDADPLEEAPRSPVEHGDQAAVARMHERLEEIEREDARADAAAAAPTDAPQISEEERRELEERMKLLGYM